jgi:biuret amidohydrolase
MSDWEMVGKPALLFIHMQRAIVKEGSPLDGLGHSRATRESGIIPRQQALLKAFRDKGLPVIYVNAITPPDAKFPVYGKFWPFVAKTMVNKPGTPDVEVIDELAPQAGEPLFYNWPFGIFQGNDLADYLSEEGIETLVLSGVATGMAVGTAVFACADRFLNLIVPEDASTDGNQQLHDCVFQSMIPAIALVTTTQDVIDHL